MTLALVNGFVTVIIQTNTTSFMRSMSDRFGNGEWFSIGLAFMKENMTMELQKGINNTVEKNTVHISSFTTDGTFIFIGKGSDKRYVISVTIYFEPPDSIFNLIDHESWLKRKTKS